MAREAWRGRTGGLSGNLIVQLGLVTEDLNRRWYEANTGQVITDIQKQVRRPALRWMAATLDGRGQGSDAVFEAKFMLPWSSRRKPPPKNICRSCNIICGSLLRGRRSFQ